MALKYCRENDTKKKYHIYIWRYSNDGLLKKSFCCNSCSNLIKKYNYCNRIFTFHNDEIVNAIIDDPQISIGYRILRDTY